MPKIALFQPEIAGNVGSIIRSCACFGADLEIIEPCGFPFDIQRIKKSALDYIKHVKITRHNSFEEFYDKEIIKENSRLILASTKASQDYRQIDFKENDVIIFGQESKGAPDFIHEKSDLRVKIMMKNNMRSLNLAISAAIILAQTT